MQEHILMHAYSQDKKKKSYMQQRVPIWASFGFEYIPSLIRRCGGGKTDGEWDKEKEIT